MKITVIFLLALYVLSSGSLCADPEKTTLSHDIRELIIDVNDEAGNEVALATISSDTEEIVSLLEKIVKLDKDNGIAEGYRSRWNRLRRAKEDIAQNAYFGLLVIIGLSGALWPLLVTGGSC